MLRCTTCSTFSAQIRKSKKESPIEHPKGWK
jgi:hypothetical protein